MTHPEGAHESLPLRGLHVLAPWGWRVLVVTVVVLAVYVAVGRFLMTQVPALREPLLASINARVPFTLHAEQLAGGWSAFSPQLRFGAVRLSSVDADFAPLALAGGGLRIDMASSIRSRSLQLSELEVQGLSLDAALTDDGSIELRGFRGGGGAALRDWIETFLPNVRRVTFRDSTLRLAIADGTVLDLGLDLTLEREGNARLLQGSLQGPQLTLAVHAQGVGNPLRPSSWSGDVFVDASSPALDAFGGIWDTLQWPFAIAGEVAAQFWLRRADGTSTASMRFEGRALRLEERGGAWSLPIDALAFEAALDQRARHWSLLTEDFHIERSGQTLDLDRAQFDWWGQALRVRASDLGIDALPALLAAAPGLPAGLRAALPDLAPRGEIGAIELRLDDLRRPAASWQLRAALDAVEVSSWRGTPALTGVTGYLDLGPAGGRLLLDSSDFSMHYPKVYRQPLRYRDAAGELRIHWDAGSLAIDSGLLELVGDEGRARGLFALDIPLQERPTGIELELLVGLEDSRARYRDRYLPYALPEPLLDWLGRSVRTAAVDSAGFVWRGSTRRGQAAHRSIQLFVDAREGVLAFDPAWPALEDLAATIWVDDGRTFARASQAAMVDVALQDLVVRALPQPGRVRLDVAAGLAGDASAADVLLGDSPLAALTGQVFADWQFRGAVSGELAMSLELGEAASAPWIDLSLGLDGVQATVAQVGLPLTDVTGQLAYRSNAGFAGSLATARVLGGELRVEALPTGREGLQLALAGDIEAGALGDWLDLPLLDFASGRAPVEGRVYLDPARGAGLEVSSDLLGVSLDAPNPFTKAPGQPLSLDLAVPLRADPRIDLSLGDRLRVALEFEGRELARTVAVLGGAAPRPAACAHRYCLAGALSTLDIVAWADFYRRYGGAPRDVDTAAPPFDFGVDSLAIGELLVGGRSFGGMRVDLWGEPARWQGAVESAWLRGSITPRDGGRHLLIEDLDLSRFAGGGDLALDTLLPLLPEIRVDVLDLHDGERALGELGFDLVPRPEEGALYAAAVEGTLWGLRLADPYPGLLRWATDDGGEKTAIEVDAAFDDLGAVLQMAGVAPGLESERGSASVRLRWPGSPMAFAAARAEGDIAVDARRGRVLESRPGPLALIGFLNFAEILRGLSLSYMFDTGIPFDRARAELHLHGGTVEVSQLEIAGATSNFAFTGVSDLRERQINGELVVTLPVAGNLPWLAALAGGPAVAAGVFVVSKVFEKQVNRMSSAVYGVSGAIDAPEVEFRRLFDDQLSPSLPVPEDSGTGDG